MTVENPIEKIYEKYLGSVDSNAAMEDLVIAFIRHYRALSYEQLSMFIGMDIHETRNIVKLMRGKKQLAEEGLITI